MSQNGTWSKQGCISNKQGNDWKPSDVYLCICNLAFGSSDSKKVQDSLIAPFSSFFVWEWLWCWPLNVVVSHIQRQGIVPARGPTVPRTPPSLGTGRMWTKHSLWPLSGFTLEASSLPLRCLERESLQMTPSPGPPSPPPPGPWRTNWRGRWTAN